MGDGRWWIWSLRPSLLPDCGSLSSGHETRYYDGGWRSPSVVVACIDGEVTGVVRNNGRHYGSYYDTHKAASVEMLLRAARAMK